MDTFLRDLSSAVNVDVPDDISSLTSLYDTALRTVLDSHAPIKERHVILRSKTPWYNASLRQAKQLRRRCERRMMKSGLQIDKDIYRSQCKTYYQHLAQAQKEYYQSQVESCDQRKLFQVVKN